MVLHITWNLKNLEESKLSNLNGNVELYFMP